MSANSSWASCSFDFSFWFSDRALSYNWNMNQIFQSTRLLLGQCTGPALPHHSTSPSTEQRQLQGLHRSILLAFKDYVESFRKKIIWSVRAAKNNSVGYVYLGHAGSARQHLFWLLHTSLPTFLQPHPSLFLPRYLTLHGVLSPLVLFWPSEELWHLKKATVIPKGNGNRKRKEIVLLFCAKDSQCRFLQQQAASKVHALTIIRLKILPFYSPCYSPLLLCCWGQLTGSPSGCRHWNGWRHDRCRRRSHWQE